MASYDEIELGDEVKDSITGYHGIVVAFTTWLNNCRRLTVQSKELRDGKPIESSVFDIEQFVMVKKAKPVRKAFTGGSRPDTGARPSNPSR